MSGSAPTPQAMTLPPASDSEKKSGWTLSYGLLQQVADSDAVREWGVGMEGAEAVLLTIAALGRPVVPRDDTAELVDLRRRVVAFDENLEAANSPELLPCFNQRLYGEWKELVLGVRAALREAGVE